jgi:hypothetical protein
VSNGHIILGFFDVIFSMWREPEDLPLDHQVLSVSCIAGEIAQEIKIVTLARSGVI